MATNMKNSDIPWIGYIPSNWAVDKYKSVMKRHTEKNHPQAEVLSVYRDYGVIPKDSRDDNHNKTAEDTSSYIYVKKGDFVINKMKAWQGSMGVSEYNGIVSPAYYCYRFVSDKVFPKYLHYLLRNCYKDEFRRLSGGMREGQWDLPAYDLEHTMIVIPPIKEQSRIADYLDKKCEAIDAAIAVGEKEIEKLKAYKQTVITKAVTKGLNHDVKMKESGIEWIGDMPEKWELRKIKNLFRRIGSGTTPESSNFAFYDGNINWLQSGDLNAGLVNCTEKKVTNTALNAIPSLKVYDAPFLSIAMYGASIGNFGYVTIPACTNQACCNLAESSNACSAKFVFYVLYATKAYLISRGVGGTQPNINAKIIKNLKIPLPSIDQQISIAKYLDERCSFIEDLVNIRMKQVNKLEAYKKSVIYTYVTGKKEVPND